MDGSMGMVGVFLSVLGMLIWVYVQVYKQQSSSSLSEYIGESALG